MAAALIIDPTWSVADQRREHDPRAQRTFFLAAGITLGAGWSVAMAAGVLIGGHLDVAALGVAAPLSLVSLLAPRLRSRRAVLVVGAATVATLVGRTWPAGTAMVAAIAAGSVVGSWGRRP